MTPKPAFQSILFPVDFSKMSATTVPHVRGLAQLTGATVTLLHVVPWLSGWYGATEVRPPVTGDEVLRELQKRQTLALEAFQEKYFSDLRCLRYVKEGAVAETITDTAQEIAADLIMMPTRGLGPSRRFLIGSTTAKVLHDAPCAVWTSPHLHELRPFAGFHHLLCTINRNEVLPKFLKEIARVASSFGCKVSFVTALPSTTGGLPEKRTIRTLVEEYPEAELHDELGHALECSVFLEPGPIGEAVQRLVDEQKIDLVVTNRGHLTHPFGKLRTHVYEIVLESPCPVLSVCVSAEPETEKHIKSSRSGKYARIESTPA